METESTLENKIKQLYIDGWSKNKISKELGIKMSKVNYILYIKLRLQDQFRRRFRHPEIIEKIPRHQFQRIIQLTNFGYSPKEIAEDQKIPAMKVHQVVQYAKERNQIQKLI